MSYRRRFQRNSSLNGHFLFLLDIMTLFHPNRNALKFHISPKLILPIGYAMIMPADLIGLLSMNLCIEPMFQ
jgi:hypothetical protein